jgi:hypothetical protein
VPNGVHPACVPTVERDADDFIDQLLGADTGTVDILHVGTCIRRKRIDRLLDIVAGDSLARAARQAPESGRDADRRSSGRALAHSV